MTARAAEMWRSREPGPRLWAPGPASLGLGIAMAALAATLSVALLPLVLEPLMPQYRLVHLAASGGVAVLVAALLGSWLVRHVTAPLGELRHAVEAMDGRDLDWAGPRHGLAGLADRPDEIGRLSMAVRQLINGVSERIAENEALAADIAHEIRNPLASLRSAAEAMRRVEDDQRERLLAIMENDVSRLDRLVGEISSATRLDAELVCEEARQFDLLTTIRELVTHLTPGAAAKGIEVIVHLPPDPMPFVGLEARLVQVIVNLVDNAVSLCEEGDALRVWVRRRDDRALIVVEDTGPGIPDGSAERIFHRFYSNRPGTAAGGNCGLGLAIARQIVEAHRGVIWAENIRPTENDLLSEPLGARFVVALPL